MRGFGGVRKRVLPGDWPGESVNCGAAHALRLESDPKKLPEAVRDVATALSCGFRRLVADGLAGVRFEMAFTQNPGCQRLFPMGPPEVSRLIKSVLELPVSVMHPGAPVARALGDCGGPLAAHYLRSTTARTEGKTPATEGWWISPGSPQLIIEYESGETTGLPPYSQRVPGTEEWEVDVHHLWFRYKGQQQSVWLLGRKKQPLSDPDWDRLRRLWIQLLRLHAERECLQQVLWAIAEKKINATAGTGTSDVLQNYIEVSFQNLSRKNYAGLPQEDIQWAQQFEDLVNPKQRDELLEQLGGIRQSLFKKVAQATGAPVENKGAPALQPIDVFVSYSHQDKVLCEELRKYLSMLRYQGLIRDWYDRGILGGEDWAKVIDERLNAAGLILLLISQDFIASDYCFKIETTRALERRATGDAMVVPILLRNADWKYPPLGALEPLPKDFKPIEERVPMSAAFTEVVGGIRELIESTRSRAASPAGD